MTRAHARRRLLFAIPVALAGCATPFSLVPPERQTVRDVFSVEPGARWNRVNLPLYDGNVEIWTQDGLALNALMFVSGTTDGTPIFVPRGGSGAKGEAPPAFHSNMTPYQISELFGATLTRAMGTSTVETSGLRAAQLGGLPGFAFDTTWTGKDEVDRVGRAVGTLRNGRLYLVWFQGTRLYHFQRYLPDFERVVASVRFEGGAK